jgi:hypothetical protein
MANATSLPNSPPYKKKAVNKTALNHVAEDSVAVKKTIVKPKEPSLENVTT